jgi:4-amino-4-deoxy-L-arabinose transferase-like glycosyltransferase
VSGPVPLGARISPRLERILLLIILLVGLFLRLYRLDEIPPGLTHDEADTGYFVEAVYRGAPSQVEGPYGYINEPFTQYSGALFMALFGPNDLALRLHAAFFGTLLILFTYLWGRETFHRAAALGGAALVAVSFWTVMDSRFALNSAPVPALVTAAAFFMWRALGDGVTPRARGACWALFALCLAGSLYTYEAARAAAVAFALFLPYMALFDRERLRQRGRGFALALAAGLLLAAPHLLDPAAWGRSQTLSVPLQALFRGDVRPLGRNILSALGTFTVRGDSFTPYNLPGRPIFDPLTGALFYAGVALCVWRWRRAPYAFLLLWLVMGLSPSLVIGRWNSTLHSKAAEAPIMLLPALAAVELGRALARRAGRRWARAFAALCGVWLALVTAQTSYDYFVRWGRAPETRAAYFHNLTAIAEYLDETEHQGAVALSSPFPDVPLDPFIVDMRLQRDDLQLRWFNARRALVFPAAAHSLLILPPNTPPHPRLAEALEAPLVERVHLAPEDVDPYFDVLAWQPRAAHEALRGQLDRWVTVGEGQARLPLSFGGAVELQGYARHPATPTAGGTMTLTTLWRVQDPGALGPVPRGEYDHAVAIFVQLLSAGGEVLGQEDRLDAPAWNWRAGDAFAQVHQLALDAELAPGSYPLVLGVYDRRSMERLPLLTDDGALVDHLRLPAVEVSGP